MDSGKTFKGDINLYRKYEFISLIVFIEIFIFFLTFALNEIAAGITLAISIIIIIYVFVYIKENEYTIFFEYEKILINKLGDQVCYTYQNIKKIKFSKPIEHQKSISIKFNDGRSFSFRPISHSINDFESFLMKQTAGNSR